ncbi:hypothetical protein [Bacillus cereus]|nr:hypothetical protein [Bacillus cereus]EEL51413.1 hypothetical protein bcere0022_12540 [Bacillus cereus Rock3-44]
MIPAGYNKIEEILTVTDRFVKAIDVPNVLQKCIRVMMTVVQRKV